MIGEDLVRNVGSSAQQSGVSTSRTALIKPLYMSGVGTGSHAYSEQINCPIAFQTSSGKVELHNLRAPIVTGEGSHLPGLLGLRSLEDNNAILDIGNRTLHLLPKGKAQMKLPPGAFSIPLQQAPSGHLVMTIDSNGQVQQARGGLSQRTLNLQTQADVPVAIADQPPQRTAVPAMSKEEKRTTQH